MPSVTDDAARPNPLTESVPGEVMILSNDFSVGLDHPRTDEDLEMLEDIPAFLDDLYKLLRAYKKYTEGDTGYTPYDDAPEDFLDTWEDTPSSRPRSSHNPTTSRISAVTRSDTMSNTSTTTTSDNADSTAPFAPLSRLAYAHVTHAPLHERYMPSGNFETIGEPGEYGPIDPETGAECRALGGLDHQYNRDYKVGSSYPKTVFVRAEDTAGDSFSHEALEAGLRARSLWSDALTPVLLPKGIEEGRATWYAAFQFRPPERAPSLRRVERQLDRVFDDADIYHEGAFLDARFWHE